MSETDVPPLPKGCGYMGHDFGATYIDSECYGGRLYDLDNGESGILFEPLVFIACPDCNHEEWLTPILEECEEEGMVAASDGKPREAPYVKSKLRYSNDYSRLVEAFFRGFDNGEQTVTGDSP